MHPNLTEHGLPPDYRTKFKFLKARDTLDLEKFRFVGAGIFQACIKDEILVNDLMDRHFKGIFVYDQTDEISRQKNQKTEKKRKLTKVQIELKKGEARERREKKRRDTKKKRKTASTKN